MNSVVRIKQDEHNRDQGECPWVLPTVDSPPNWSADDGHDCEAQKPVDYAHVRTIRQEHQ